LTADAPLTRRGLTRRMHIIENRSDRFDPRNPRSIASFKKG
jgi:hypothetical protein